MPDWTNIINQLNHSTGKSETLKNHKMLGGGSINSAFYVQMDSGADYFIKTNGMKFKDMFAAEYDSLIEFQRADSLHIPQPYCYGSTQSECFIVMEYLSLQSRGDSFELGRCLAQMHRITADRFGWHRNNTIGSTPQSNRQCDDWIEFWRLERLTPQFEMLFMQGHRGRFELEAKRLLAQLDDFFAGHTPQASLLHGDLWSGNYAFDQKGQGTIFDPALYYGDRETDLAMTELFGGFSTDFYSGYQEEFPLADGYNKRKSMYNLYHILNHANLFGGSYLNQADHLLRQLII